MMRKRNKNALRDQSGAAAVEFAFVAPVAILMIFGVIESGRLMFMLNSMEAALASAGREWMIDPDATNDQVRTRFCAHAVLVNCSTTTFSFTTQTINGQAWRVVTASTPFGSPIAGLLPLPEKLTRTQRTPLYVPS